MYDQADVIEKFTPEALRRFEEIARRQAEGMRDMVEVAEGEGRRAGLEGDELVAFVRAANDFFWRMANEHIPGMVDTLVVN